MVDVPIKRLATTSMGRLRELNLESSEVASLDTTPLHSLVWIRVNRTPMTEIDLCSCEKLEEIEGCSNLEVFTSPGVKRRG